MLQKTLHGDGDDVDLVVLDSCEDEDEPKAGIGDQSANPISVDSSDDTSGETSKNPIEIANQSVDSTLDDFEFVKPTLKKSGSVASIQTFGELGTGSPCSSAPGTPGSPFSENMPSFKGTFSKSKDFSTPIMKRVGSIENIPSDVKFSRGIEEHIPFENLPDATGNFEKMRKLVGKIRKLKPNFLKKK